MVEARRRLPAWLAALSRRYRRLQVGRGIRAVDKMSVLLDLADVLHVDVQALTGSSVGTVGQRWPGGSGRGCDKRRFA